MTLTPSAKSVSARLYKWFYSTYLPTNLCPYFWKSIIMYIFIVPYFLVTVSLLIVDKFTGEDDFNYEDTGTRFFRGIAVWAVLWGAICLLVSATGIFIHFPKNSPLVALMTVGIAEALMGVIILLFWSVARVIEHFKNRKRKSYVQTPNLTIEFIKAKYNKYCPKIEWRDE